MKIQIEQPEISLTGGYKISSNGKRIKNQNSMASEFSEDEVYFLIGAKNYEKFESGKFEFNVPAYLVQIVEGRLNTLDNYKTKLSLQYKELR